MVRFVALGDSLTEGAGDPYPSAPNGLRGWADLVAAHLAATHPGAEYANLALRGRRARDVLRDQVPVAVALEPTVVTLWVGGNDLMRPYTDLREVTRSVEEILRRLLAAGSRVLVLTSFEGSPSPLLRPAAGRIAALNARLRDVTARHGAEVVEVADFTSWSTAPVLSRDRVHPSPLGHRLLAARVAGALGAGPVDAADLLAHPPAPVHGRAHRLLEEARWWCADVVPHLVRWLTDAASSDGAVAKWAAPVPVADLVAAPGTGPVGVG